jgi:hypothetical protein
VPRSKIPPLSPWMGMASVMRPIDAHATGFFSSGIMERNGFLAAAEHLITAEPPDVQSGCAILSRNGFGLDPQ